MQTTIKSTKEQVRAYIGQRATEHKPLPSIEEIRRQLGWDLLKPKY